MRRSLEQGFSLIELTLSLGVSLLLASLIFNQYFSIKQQFIQLSKRLHQQLDSELSVDTLRLALFNAGFTPYGSLEKLRSMPSPLASPLKAIEPLSAPKQGFTIRKMGAQSYPLHKNEGSQIHILSKKNIQLKQPLIVVNWCCYQILKIRDILQSSKEHFILLNAPLHPIFQKGSLLGQWIEESYFIKLSSSGRNGLYYKNKHAEQLHWYWNDLKIVKINGQRPGIELRYKTTLNHSQFTLMVSTPNASL